MSRAAYEGNKVFKSELGRLIPFFFGIFLTNSS